MRFDEDAEVDADHVEDRREDDEAPEPDIVRLAAPVPEPANPLDE